MRKFSNLLLVLYMLKLKRCFLISLFQIPPQFPSGVGRSELVGQTLIQYSDNGPTKKTIRYDTCYSGRIYPTAWVFLYYVGLHSPTYELFPPQSETTHVLVVSLFVLTMFIDFIGLIIWKAW